MDSRRLSAELESVRAVIMRQSGYLNRLVDRMVKLHWRVDDIKHSKRRSSEKIDGLWRW